jgi:hypothetical protein
MTMSKSKTDETPWMQEEESLSGKPATNSTQEPMVMSFVAVHTCRVAGSPACCHTGPAVIKLQILMWEANWRHCVI